MFLLLLILIICLLYFYNRYRSYENYKMNNNQYKNYRLGDLIKGYIRKEEPELYKLYPLRYKNTIAAEYIKMTKNKIKKDNNYELLKQICDRKQIVNNDDMVIHMRLGDAITGKKGDKYIFQSFMRNFLQPYDYNKLFKKTKDFKNVTLIFGFHHGRYNKKLTRNYIDDVKKIFTNKGISVREKLSSDPDYVLCYMSQSNHFVMSGGGFSKLIAEVVKLNGNKVYSLKML